MPRSYVYACTKCGAVNGTTPEEQKANLTSRGVIFKEVGFRGRIKKSRVTAWLCDKCLKLDSDWNSPQRQMNDATAKDRA